MQLVAFTLMKFLATAYLIGPRRVCYLSLICLTQLLSAQSSPVVQTRDVITEEALRQQVSKTPSLKSQLAVTAKPVTEKAPAIQSSLWSRSIILTDGEMYTLVPVGSILHLPTTLRDRVVAKPVGQFTFWPNFLKRNSSWLGGHEVTLAMAKGDAKAAKSVLQSISKDSRMLVAIYKGGPVTILEAAPEK